MAFLEVGFDQRRIGFLKQDFFHVLLRVVDVIEDELFVYPAQICLAMLSAYPSSFRFWSQDDQVFDAD